MSKKTETLGSYAALARDLERKVRRQLVDQMNEEDVLNRADKRVDADLTSKYRIGMDRSDLPTDARMAAVSGQPAGPAEHEPQPSRGGEGVLPAGF